MLKNSTKEKKKKGRPKESWTHSDTAKELGISRQSVENAIIIARATELYPKLAEFKGSIILKIIRLLRRITKEGLNEETFKILKDLEEKQGISTDHILKAIN